MQQVTATYNPRVFDAVSVAAARAIILTPDGAVGTDERWRRETPHLVDLMAGLDLNENSVVLDYGCGIGRLAGALIARYHCRVIGADISANMRALAASCVPSERFIVCHPDAIGALELQCDAALAVWVLQHCLRPAQDLAGIHRALKPGGRFFVVNETTRCVPTIEHPWVDDGIDIRQCCRDAGFTDRSCGALSAEHDAFWLIANR